jgi:hypothetical protein
VGGENSLHQNITTFSCKYCNYETAEEADFDHHTVTKHPKKAGYSDRNGVKEYRAKLAEEFKNLKPWDPSYFAYTFDPDVPKRYRPK